MSNLTAEQLIKLEEIKSYAEKHNCQDQYLITALLIESAVKRSASTDSEKVQEVKDYFAAMYQYMDERFEEVRRRLETDHTTDD